MKFTGIRVRQRTIGQEKGGRGKKSRRDRGGKNRDPPSQQSAHKTTKRVNQRRDWGARIADSKKDQ